MNDSFFVAVLVFFLLVFFAIGFINMGNPDTATQITLIICLTIGFLAVCALLALGYFQDNRGRIQETKQLAEAMEMKMAVLEKKFYKDLEEKTKPSSLPPSPPPTELQQLITLAKDTKTVVRTERPPKGAVVVIQEEIHPVLAKLLKEKLSNNSSLKEK
jgi:hypothetical protein